MVDVWGVGLFIGGLALLAIELAYPRRYVGVIGIDLTLLGLLLMLLPDTLSASLQAGLVLLVLAASTAVAIPFYRRYAPHVGPMRAPDVSAGDFGLVVESIPAQGEGLVRAGGILWSARADESIAAGTNVRILVMESDRLVVEPGLPPTPHEGGDHQERSDEGRGQEG